MTASVANRRAPNLSTSSANFPASRPTPDFHAFTQAGKRLLELNIDYENQPEHKLQQIESQTAEVSFRVTRMTLNRKDRSELKYNDFLTLHGIPLDVYTYRLGNRSALEWVIDPNREDDPQYILRLIGQVITVSLETNAIVANLPTLGLEEQGKSSIAEAQA